MHNSYIVSVVTEHIAATTLSIFDYVHLNEFKLVSNRGLIQLSSLQDSLSARGISYVLSVSRCSPQPSFLPASQYLRIPIDDSLRDDLLPWIPAALRFIGTRMMMQYRTPHL